MNSESIIILVVGSIGILTLIISTYFWYINHGKELQNKYKGFFTPKTEIKPHENIKALLKQIDVLPLEDKIFILEAICGQTILVYVETSGNKTHIIGLRTPGTPGSE